jgi:hypothetical protein
MNKDKFGFQNLAKKGLAVITAALSTLSHSKAEVLPTNHELNNDKNISYESIHKNVLKPRLVLKLNVSNPEKSFVLMHSSHSSHRSHSSHSSHSSHYSSSYSSGRSYSTPVTPTYSPSGGGITPASVNTAKKVAPGSSGSTNPNVNTKTNVSSFYNRNTKSTPIADSQHLKLGDRPLYKGCEGTDVEALQKILMKIKKNMFVTGYFGIQTEIIIIKFQQDNELRPNGIVDRKTLNALIKRTDGSSSK